MYVYFVALIGIACLLLVGIVAYLDWRERVKRLGGHRPDLRSGDLDTFLNGRPRKGGR